MEKENPSQLVAPVGGGEEEEAVKATLHRNYESPTRLRH